MRGWKTETSPAAVELVNLPPQGPPVRAGDEQPGGTGPRVIDVFQAVISRAKLDLNWNSGCANIGATDFRPPKGETPELIVRGFLSGLDCKNRTEYKPPWRKLYSSPVEAARQLHVDHTGLRPSADLTPPRYRFPAGCPNRRRYSENVPERHPEASSRDGGTVGRSHERGPCAASCSGSGPIRCPGSVRQREWKQHPSCTSAA